MAQQHWLSVQPTFLQNQQSTQYRSQKTQHGWQQTPQRLPETQRQMWPHWAPTSSSLFDFRSVSFVM